MNLRFVSLTGADDKVSITRLEQFTEQYPLFEAAILMFPERDSLARNPSREWREKFYKSQVKNRAIHLCGSAINKLAEENSDLLSELSNVQRVQINLKPQWATEKLLEQLVTVVEKNPQIEFITQYNDNNKEYFEYWKNIANHSYLYDNSLGKGTAPELWLPPIIGKRTGYAGGLNHKNINENLEKINAVSHNENIWIDMETGVRTNDEFDLLKANVVLESVHIFVTKNYIQKTGLQFK